MGRRLVLLAVLTLALALPLGAVADEHEAAGSPEAAEEQESPEAAEEQDVVSADARKSEKYRPTGTVTVNAKSVSVGLEVSWGKGTLHWQGEDYPFKVGGLGLVGIGGSGLVAEGQVFNLDKLEDFNGTWGQVSGSVVLVKGDAGGITLRNRGVYMTLGSQMKGAQITVGGGALNIELLDVAAE